MESNDGFIVLTSNLFTGANDEAVSEPYQSVIFLCSRPLRSFQDQKRPVFSSIAFQGTANLPFVQEDNVNTTLQASLHS